MRPPATCRNQARRFATVIGGRHRRADRHRQPVGRRSFSIRCSWPYGSHFRHPLPAAVRRGGGTTCCCSKAFAPAGTRRPFIAALGLSVLSYIGLASASLRRSCRPASSPSGSGRAQPRASNSSHRHAHPGADIIGYTAMLIGCSAQCLRAGGITMSSYFGSYRTHEASS